MALWDMNNEFYDPSLSTLQIVIATAGISPGSRIGINIGLWAELRALHFHRSTEDGVGFLS